MNDTSRALSALNYLNPSCPREEWVRIGMAVKAAGLDFEDFHNWSKSAGNYAGEKDCKAVWKSLDAKGGITEATLFSAALKAGWQDPNKSHNTHRTESNNTRSYAQNILERCVPASSSHEYIQRKKGEADGVFVYPDDAPLLTIMGKNVAGYLVVPCLSNGEPQTLQFIPPEIGEKLNLSGATFGNGYFIVGNMSSIAYVCEGIGQAWAIYQASGVASIVSFGASRMKIVSKTVKEQYPDCDLVIVSDRGKEDLASEIASSLCAKFVELPQDKPANYDVNDYAQEFGYEALANLLANPQIPNLHYQLLSGNDLCNAPPMRWMVRGVVPSEGLAALYGASGSGKSFLTLDMACAIAGGEYEWFGLRITQAPVAYLCLEGEAGLGKRIKAWSLHHKKPFPAALQFVVQPFDLLSDDVSELAKSIIAIQGFGGLVIIDTLNRAAPGADENSSVDMGNLIAAAKKLQILTKGLVLLVHHTGKDATKELRGHSSLYAALDGAIKVIKSDNRLEWGVAKSKDDVTGVSYSFKLEVVQVGHDDEGDAITSCVTKPCENIADAIRRAPPPKAGNQKIIWDEVQKMFWTTQHFGKGGAPEGRPCLLLEDVIEKAKGRLVCEKKRQTERTQAAIKGLVSHGLLEHRDGWLWPI